jgi:hypothetical protein
MTLSNSDNDHRHCRNGQQLKDLGLRHGYGGESGVRAARRKREEKTCDYAGIHDATPDVFDKGRSRRTSEQLLKRASPRRRKTSIKRTGLGQRKGISRINV